jgi:hypothetical protein
MAALELDHLAVPLESFPAIISQSTAKKSLRQNCYAHRRMERKGQEHHEKRDLIEGFRLGAKNLSARGAELEKIADAAKPLYDSLDDGQKHRFSVLLP